MHPNEIHKMLDEISAFYSKLCRFYFEHLRELAEVDYKDYLNTIHWKEISKKAKENAGYKCQLCYKNDSLQAHHKSYEHLGYGTEEIEDLIVLCSECHAKFHNKEYGEPI